MPTTSSIPKHALRRAAILVATLDRDAADALLEQMPPADAEAVRSAVLRLGDVSESEVRRIVEEFLRERKPIADDLPDDGGVEVAPSLARRFASGKPKAAEGPRRFASLHGASIAAIARVLGNERPQTAALVLSHLTPERSADVLAHLPGAFQTEVLERIASLEDPDPDFVGEIERHLEQALKDSQDRVSSVRTAPGLPLAEAIKNITAERMTIPLASGRAPVRERADERLRFEQLAALDNRAWLRILGASDPQVALLALAGADAALVDRILKSLPRRERKRLRHEMNDIGPLRLKDVDRAQQRIADRAAELAESGAIPNLQAGRQLSAAA